MVERGEKRYTIELKLWDGPQVVDEGIEQLSRYMDRLGVEEGWLVVFDRREGRTWDEKIYQKELEGPRGQRIHLFGA